MSLTLFQANLTSYSTEKSGIELMIFANNRSDVFLFFFLFPSGICRSGIIFCGSEKPASRLVTSSAVELFMILSLERES